MIKIRRFTEKEIKNIIIDYKNNMTFNEMSIKYNRDSAVILMKLVELGIHTKKNRRWTKDEIEYLKNNYALTDWEEILENLPNMTKEQIITKAYKLKIKRDIFFWNDEDIQILKENYYLLEISELRELLNNKFTEIAIYSKANVLGLKIREFWDDEEIQILKDNYYNLEIEEICKLLPKRNKESIRSYAHKLKLIHNNKSIWNDEEVEFIKLHWENKTDDEMSKILNRTFRSVKWKRETLGLFRNTEAGMYNSLSEYIRKRNKQWKIDSIKQCSYKCILSGKRFDAIHHLYGMNLIINDTLDFLEVEIKDEFNDYTELELNQILVQFFIEQSKHPLGVCLTEEIHKDFHNKYGYGNNTEAQFNEYVTEYKNKLKNP